jgi:hypothetical protein
LTFWLMVLFWTVMASGVAGYVGQRVCYRIMSFVVEKECGPERWEGERRRLMEEFATVTSKQQSPAIAYDRFRRAAQEFLESDWKSWTWLFSRAAHEPVPVNLYEHVRALTNQEQCAGIEAIWSQVQQRRELDMERVFHRMARCWIVVHRAAAAILFLLVIAHVVSSIRFGGW